MDLFSNVTNADNDLEPRSRSKCKSDKNKIQFKYINLIFHNNWPIIDLNVDLFSNVTNAENDLEPRSRSKCKSNNNEI